MGVVNLVCRVSLRDQKLKIPECSYSLSSPANKTCFRVARNEGNGQDKGNYHYVAGSIEITEEAFLHSLLSRGKTSLEASTFEAFRIRHPSPYMTI